MERLAEIYRELQPKLFAYFFVKTSNMAVAEDLTQDVFYEASKSLAQFRGEASMATWLFRIANNLLKKYYRSKKYERSLLERIDDMQALPSTEHIVQQKDAAERLLMRLQQLEVPLKDIMLLRIVAELSFKEIGELLGFTENYVRVTFHRQKLKLQREEEGL